MNILGYSCGSKNWVWGFETILFDKCLCSGEYGVSMKIGKTISSHIFSGIDMYKSYFFIRPMKHRRRVEKRGHLRSSSVDVCYIKRKIKSGFSVGVNIMSSEHMNDNGNHRLSENASA